ncbi:Protein csh3 [Exserohilum turcicum]
MKRLSSRMKAGGCRRREECGVRLLCGHMPRHATAARRRTWRREPSRGRWRRAGVGELASASQTPDITTSSAASSELGPTACTVTSLLHPRLDPGLTFSKRLPQSRILAPRDGAHALGFVNRISTPSMAPGAANNFAQFMVVGPTCFFLGILFAQLPYDYNVLWTTPTDVASYFDILESHIKFLYASPPIVSRILNLAIGTGILGFLIKLFKPNQANMLFDGASLVLYMAGITVYLTNIVKGFRVVTAGIYGDLDKASPGEVTEEDQGDYISREDTLRVFAASNTILALVLVGVLVLQAGQWYAKRAEEKEIQEIERLAEEKKVAGKKKL